MSFRGSGWIYIKFDHILIKNQSKAHSGSVSNWAKAKKCKANSCQTKNAKLIIAKLSHAKLRNAKLRDAKLRDARAEGHAKLKNAKIIPAKLFIPQSLPPCPAHPLPTPMMLQRSQT